MYIKVYFKGDELDVFGNLTAVKFLPDKKLLLLYQGGYFRSLFLDDIEKIILKEEKL